MAQSEPDPQDSQLRDALLDAVGWALRILGGMVQMAAGVTRVVAVAVIRAAAAAEKAAEASEEDGEKSEQKPMPHPRSKRLGERKSREHQVASATWRDENPTAWTSRP